MDRKFNHLIDMDDYTVGQWNTMLSLAEDIMHNPVSYSKKCENKIMATLFYEPSTRTQMSFQAAMLRLGGTIIGFDNPATSSVSKGENLKDTTKIVSSYADILVMRHPQEGSAKAAALTADCPIINAGDGGHLHPTQTLTDLLTLKIEKGGLENLTIGVCGDLKNGRTVHSLVKALCCYKGNRFILISTPELRLPSYIKDFLNASGTKYTEVDSIESCISQLDVLYMTRIQRERFSNPEDYDKQKNVYRLDREKMVDAKQNMIVMHPLPRVDEIDTAVDDDARALYFKQAKYGVFVRMALILTTLSSETKSAPLLCGTEQKHEQCTNPRCITQTEKYLPRSFRKSGSILECEYCDFRTLF